MFRTADLDNVTLIQTDIYPFYTPDRVSALAPKPLTKNGKEMLTPAPQNAFLPVAAGAAETAFSAIKEKLRLALGDSLFRAWVHPLSFVDYTHGVLTLGAPSRFVRDWVKSHYADRLAQMMTQAQLPCRGIEWNILAGPVAAHSEPAPANENAGQTEGAQRAESDPFASPLDPRLTFGSFVVGDSNKLAFTAAERIAAAPQAFSGPFVIHGAVGQGKTHLLQAIANDLRLRSPEKKTVYMSAEKFMYSFVRALQKRETMSFKDYFRGIDVFLIDDIQFICGKESTQQEFFHTFNALADQGKTIVLSCDRPPAALNGLDERLKSRFGMGLVAHITPANEELRLKILNEKCRAMQKHIPATVLSFLARNISSSVRELEGALNRLVAQSELLGHQVTLSLAETHLQDLIRSPDKKLTIEEIQSAVCAFFRVRMTDLLSGRRDRALARPRQLAMFLCKTLTSHSLPDIGRHFGGRDHTTILHGVRKIDVLLKTDAELSSALTQIRLSLGVN